MRLGNGSGGSALQVKALLLLSTILISTACGSTSTSSAPTGPGSLACKNGHITIGFAKEKTGPTAFIDIPGTQAVEIAIDEINAAGGIHGCQIATIFGDTKGDPATAAQVAEELIRKGAQILFVSDDFDLGVAAAQAGEKAGLLVLSSGAASTQFGKAVGPHLFSGGISTNVLGTSVARFAVSKGWKNAFILVNKALAYFTEQDTAYRSVSGVTVVGEDSNNSFTASDFSSTISKIANTNPKPDVIYDLLTFPPVATFVKQLRAAGLATPVLGDTAMASRQFPETTGKTGIDNVYYCTVAYYEGAGIDSAVDPAMVKFTQEYQAKFGTFPEGANAPDGWLFFNAIAKALKQPNVNTVDAATRAINAEQGLVLPGNTLRRWTDGYAVWDGNIVSFTPTGEFRYVTVYPSQ